MIPGEGIIPTYGARGVFPQERRKDIVPRGGCTYLVGTLPGLGVFLQLNAHPSGGTTSRGLTPPFPATYPRLGGSRADGLSRVHVAFSSPHVIETPAALTRSWCIDLRLDRRHLKVVVGGFIHDIWNHWFSRIHSQAGGNPKRELNRVCGAREWRARSRPGRNNRNDPSLGEPREPHERAAGWRRGRE